MIACLAGLLAAALAASPPTPPASARAEPATAFVLADVLRVRSGPSESDAVVARLRIGTAVELREARDAWARVRLGPAGEEVEGWVPRALVGGAPPTLADALARASAAQDAGTITWLERAAALDPGKAETWRALAEALERAGRPDRARHSRGMSAGAVPGFLASCGTLVAEWTPGTEERPLAREFARDAPDGPLPRDAGVFRRELARLADELPAATWFRFGAGPLGGSPFPRPTLREETDGCDELWVRLDVRLGPGCDSERWLATTTPLSALAAEPAPLDDRVRGALAVRGVAPLDRADVRRVPGTPTLLEVRFSGRQAATVAAMGSVAEPPPPKRVEGWALFGDSPEPLAFEALTADDPGTFAGPETPETAELEFAAWSRVALQPGVRVAAVRYAYGSGGADGQSWSESGYILVTVDAGGRVRVRRLKLEELRPC
jgi:hypothetical protein